MINYKNRSNLLDKDIYRKIKNILNSEMGIEYRINLDETVEEKYFLICILIFNVDKSAINNKDKNK